MNITYTKSEVTLTGTPMESFNAEDGSVQITLDYDQVVELMEQLRVAIELSKDF